MKSSFLFCQFMFVLENRSIPILFYWLHYAFNSFGQQLMKYSLFNDEASQCDTLYNTYNANLLQFFICFINQVIGKKQDIYWIFVSDFILNRNSFSHHEFCPRSYQLYQENLHYTIITRNIASSSFVLNDIQTSPIRQFAPPIKRFY